MPARSASGPAPSSSSAWATTTRSTCSASTASAACSATAETPGGSPGLLEGNAGQVYIQLIGIAATIVWSGVVTWILLKVIGAFVGLRVSDEAERIGLDITQHGEAVQ